MASYLEEKKKFFAGLDRLDEYSDDEPKEQQGSIYISSDSSAPTSPQARPAAQPRPTKPSTDDLSSVQTKQSKIDQSTARVSSVAKDASGRVTKPKVSETNKAQQKTKGKRRGKKEPQLLPEDEQAFRGQTFFFVPNNNIAAHRKRRIAAAIEHGAIWARQCSDAVTHVVADSHVDLDEVIKLCGGPNCVRSATIVSDRWLTESFGFKEMRDPTPARFQILRKCKDSNPTEQSKLNNINNGPKIRHQRAASQSSRASVSDEESLHQTGHSTTDDEQMRHQSAVSGTGAGARNANVGSRSDELLEIVEQVNKLDGVSLSLDDDTDQPSSSGSSEIETSDQTAGSRLERFPENAGFRCMERNCRSDGSENPNAGTINILQQMASMYDTIGDQWRTRAYRQAISQLGKQQNYIQTAEDARALPSIGTRIAAKIEEIVQASRLRRLDSAMSDPTEQLLRNFMGIYQVGYPTASKWIAQGYRSREELKSHPNLTRNQRIGIEHYHDFMQRIPRLEVEQLAAIVNQAARKADPGLEMIFGGSYRRGNTDSGDIDILITKPEATLAHVRTLVMDIVVPSLLRKGFLKVALASGQPRHVSSKWHGACALPTSSVWRRIDLLFVPWAERGAALIYFTGNDIFNRSVRLLASRKGMRLNQHGLYKDVMRGKDRANVASGTLVEGHDERKIFECLGVPWWEPHERQC